MPGPTADSVLISIFPSSYQTRILQQCYDVVSAGHIGAEKTATNVCKLRYWVGLLYDDIKYCSKCVTCQASKPLAPQKFPIHTIPFGKPWEMVAVDILSCQNNWSVVQDYLTKWAEAVLLRRHACSTTVHSDQG